MNFRLLALAGAAALPIVLSALQPADAQCMTDEGYGRYRPCDSFYKAKQPKHATKHQNPAPALTTAPVAATPSSGWREGLKCEPGKTTKLEDGATHRCQ
ncbi:MAG: hypothetical protein JO000_18995 [Alphaproteobacteria bacterium]|nr:hypothetical protein [Alphaproteobacteria bacterium]